MIKPINYEGIIKLLRETLIEYTGISSNKILNGLASRGTDLADVINSTNTYSFSLTDTFILFELLKDSNGESYSTKKGNNMLSISTYNYHLMIYGNGSDDCSQKIKSIFKNPSIASNLRDGGIYIKGITPPESINEFVNNTLLPRVDMVINLETVYESIDLKEEEYFKYNDISPEDFDLIVENF